MKAAILQCDNVLEKFQPLFGDYPKMLMQMFDGINLPLSFDTYDCKRGQFPTNINEYDFYITTGSKASVYDGLDWVQELILFIQQLDIKKKKLIGICFGHQLIAMAREGKVEKSEKGWGVGIAQNRVVANPQWMSKKTSEINILVSHKDQIVKLPVDTLLIAESDFCPFFVVQWGKHFLSIQGHPEWSSDYARAMMNDRRGIIPSDTIDAGISSLQVAPQNDVFVEWIMDFVQYLK